MINFDNSEVKNLNSFFIACNDMIQGKFILSDIKIKNILASLTKSKLIYDVVTNALSDFDFESELNAAKTSSKSNGGYFKMPTDVNKVIALVFCILLAADKKKLNLQQFVNENFFSNKGYNVSYSNFAMVVLVPFKEAFLKVLRVSEDGVPLDTFVSDVEENVIEKPIIKESNMIDTQKKINFANLTVSLTELVSAIRKNTKIKVHQKEELLIVATSMLESIRREDLKTISALVIAFEYALAGNKQIKKYYNEFLQELTVLLF